MGSEQEGDNDDLKEPSVESAWRPWRDGGSQPRHEGEGTRWLARHGGEDRSEANMMGGERAAGGGKGMLGRSVPGRERRTSRGRRCRRALVVACGG
jgi:hypothetical protein